VEILQPDAPEPLTVNSKNANPAIGSVDSSVPIKGVREPA
jgi:hypothetical protein